MKRFLIASLWCLMIVACASQQAAFTPVPTLTPSPSITSTLQPTNTPLPAIIVETSFRSGMSPEEVVSFILETRSYLENNERDALADKIYFPLNECGRNKGDNIETKEEFVQRFDEVFNNEIISDYLNANLEDTIVDMYGVYIGGIWFTSICIDSTCDVTKTWIFGVNNYCSVRRQPPMEDTQWATEEARPDYSGENFVYGIYKMESYEDHGSLITEEELKDKMQNVIVRIEKDNFSTDTDCSFGCSCPSPAYEFNKPFYGKYRALWYGLPTIDELIVICDGNPKIYFDVLADNKVGHDYFGYYVMLSHQ